MMDHKVVTIKAFLHLQACSYSSAVVEVELSSVRWGSLAAVLLQPDSPPHPCSPSTSSGHPLAS